jgi:hypothetical protein
LLVTEPTEGWNLISWVDDSVCPRVSLIAVWRRFTGRIEVLL